MTRRSVLLKNPPGILDYVTRGGNPEFRDHGKVSVDEIWSLDCGEIKDI